MVKQVSSRRLHPLLCSNVAALAAPQLGDGVTCLTCCSLIMVSTHNMLTNLQIDTNALTLYLPLPLTGRTQIGQFNLLNSLNPQRYCHITCPSFCFLTSD